MLRAEEQALIRSTLDALKTEIPGFRERKQQLRMIEAIASAMARCHERDDSERHGRNIAAVDGPPGVGKSLSYLTAALAIASTRGKRVVVSSSTVQLQAHELVSINAESEATASEPGTPGTRLAHNPRPMT